LVGVTGLASVAPPLHDVSIVFGLMLIAWFVWVGAVLTITRSTAAGVVEPHGGITSNA
jgi:hypothetical protein